MTVQSADLGHPPVRISMPSASPVPILEETAFTNPDASPRFSPWPMAALGVAIAATLIWNGFLLWAAAELVAAWIAGIGWN